MLFCLFAALLISTVLPTTALDFNDYALQRIARAPHPSSALLVPYPRVGKRSDIKHLYSENHSAGNAVQKRLYMARVGKRAFFYAPRIGK
ncbi:unnamed protein product [Caenorhabditis sp. 36 PRJEB53466]|nr:unnamed protein product [Caenorhabditis sp. 36 PRJEB53466]